MRVFPPDENEADFNLQNTWFVVAIWSNRRDQSDWITALLLGNLFMFLFGPPFLSSLLVKYVTYVRIIGDVG